MKPILLFISLFIVNMPFQLFGQVTKVKYQLKYNIHDSTYGMYLHIAKGKAIDARDRIQFNAQISLVVPTQSSVDLIQMHLPLRANQHFTGKEAMQWQISSVTLAPASLPENDFYSITPILSPTAFYNELTEGEEVKLFTFRVTTPSTSKSNIRLYENGKDPHWQAEGMNNADYTNSFTLGSVAEDYTGNEPTTQLTLTEQKNIVNDEIRLFPNPVIHQLTIETNQPLHFYNILDNNGKFLKRGQKTVVDFSAFPSGIYHIELSFGNSKLTRQMIKI